MMLIVVELEFQECAIHMEMNGNQWLSRIGVDFPAKMLGWCYKGKKIIKAHQTVPEETLFLIKSFTESLYND